MAKKIIGLLIVITLFLSFVGSSFNNAAAGFCEIPEDPITDPDDCP